MHRFLLLGFSCWLLVGAGIFAQRIHADEPLVDFSFEGVEVDTFIRLVGELTGRRFVLGSDVSGPITIVSPRVPASEVYPLFLSILDAAGFAVREEAGITRISVMRERGPALASVLGPEGEIPETGVYTKVFRLQHVAAIDVARLLEPAADRSGAVRAMEETNHIVVTDSASALRRMQALLQELDQPGLAKVMEVIPLQFALAEELARQLNLALAESVSRAQELVQRLPAGRAGGRELSRTATVVPVPHANRLIVTGTVSQIQSLRELIDQMDIDVPSGQGRLNAIFLRHLNADEAAESLTALLRQRQERSGAEAGDRRMIAIQSSPSNNALLIDASPGDFEIVRRLIDQMDVLPEQIHIGVMIVEVSDSDGLQLGIDFAALDSPSSVGDSVVQGAVSLGDASGLLNIAQSGIFPRGLSIGVAQGTSLNAEGQIQTGFPGILNIDAFRTSNRFNILSETSLQSQNNREASVRVVNEIPVLKSEITGGTGSARDVIQNIERMDVGIKLQITPHFIPGGLIRMSLNPSIEAVIDAGVEGKSFTPTIAKREVQTTVTVEDGRTIVIAGLTRRDERENERRVPVLGSIPLLRWLFTRTDRIAERNDLLILVTPTIVSSVDAQEQYRRQWQNKTGLRPDDTP
ncbi:MAG: type II secretion system secretin GspD [Kiritimatiellia bacterium]